MRLQENVGVVLRKTFCLVTLFIVLEKECHGFFFLTKLLKKETNDK